MSYSPRRMRRVLIAAGVILCGAWCVAHNWMDNTVANASPAAAVGAQVSFGSQADPRRVLGVEQANCKKCHESEVKAWMASKHYKADDRLSSPKAKEYAGALGIAAADIHKKSLCLNCHGTKTADKSGGNVHAFDYGVSCSSCHGGSGPVDGDPPGWLNPHGSYGGPNVTMEQETAAHRKMRIETCERAGMIRPARLHLLAKNCLSCHVVSHQKLVNAGHPAMHKDGFELAGWSNGEVRHNFKLDKTKNAAAPSLWMKRTGSTAANRKRMKFLVGLLAEIEADVRNLSNVAAGDGRSAFAKFFAKRLKGQKEDILAAVIEAFGKDVPEELEQIFEAVDGITISRFNFKDAAGAKKALPQIEKLTAEFARKYDGTKFGKIDDLINDIVGKPKGKVYEPK